MKPINEAAVTFLSRSANEGFARTAAACFAAQLDPTLDEVNDIKTAVSEAVTNCIVHAYPDRLGKGSMRPASPSTPPEPRSAAAWALPLWRALWTP